MNASMVVGRGAKTPVRSTARWVGVMATVLTVALATLGLADDNPNPGVVPPHARVMGKTYGQWGEVWWNWALQFPSATNPQLDTTGQFGHLGQTGSVWFLAGVFGGGSVERELTVPTGKFLFFPLVNAFSVAEGDGTEAHQRTLVNAFIDRVTVLECRIDGHPLRHLFRYRAQSPRGGFVLTVPPGSLFTEPAFGGAPPGDYAPAVSDGYWLMLAPLSPGRHEIRFHAVVGNPQNPDFGSCPIRLVERTAAFYADSSCALTFLLAWD